MLFTVGGFTTCGFDIFAVDIAALVTVLLLLDSDVTYIGDASLRKL